MAQELDVREDAFFNMSPEGRLETIRFAGRQGDPGASTPEAQTLESLLGRRVRRRKARLRRPEEIPAPFEPSTEDEPVGFLDVLSSLNPFSVAGGAMEDAQQEFRRQNEPTRR